MSNGTANPKPLNGIIALSGQSSVLINRLNTLIPGAPPDTKTAMADDETLEMPRLNISYKPQTIAPKFQGSVQDLFHLKLSNTWQSSIFRTEVLIPLDIDSLLDN